MALHLAAGLVSRVRGWSLWHIPWWGWLLAIIPEAVLLLPLVVARARQQLAWRGHRTNATVALFGVVSLVNALLLLAVVASLLGAQPKGHPVQVQGGELLFTGLTVWATNAITFGLWFWHIDRGGPAARLAAPPPPPDFLFPQLTDPALADWSPRLFDYLYVACTNAIAFSPTDTLPLTTRAKALMLAESAVSALTVLLVFARAVNIIQS